MDTVDELVIDGGQHADGIACGRGTSTPTPSCGRPDSGQRSGTFVHCAYTAVPPGT